MTDNLSKPPHCENCGQERNDLVRELGPDGKFLCAGCDFRTVDISRDPRYPELLAQFANLNKPTAPLPQEEAPQQVQPPKTDWIQKITDWILPNWR